MAPPAPSRSLEQNSPITTILRQICESYPESSCLRELLQNADDAQASEIEYTLDTRTYEGVPLIHPGLQAYHGPALLVKNNKVFTDSDFDSLASIGDSAKRNYQSPGITHRATTLLPQAMASFSRPSSGMVLQYGGNMYDILQCRESEELQNHLKTFQQAKVDTSRAVDATVIRIPLRTETQAESSKIVNRQATVEEIKKALCDLGREIRAGGMLFLRHVRKATARIDDAILWEARTTGATDEDTKAMSSIPSAFSSMYAAAPNPGQSEECSRSFHVNIEYSEGQSSSLRSFLLQHSMSRSSGDLALDAWARKRKLFPWAAVAAPLDHVLPTGRLFSCLRLPIETGQPVHIHGLFSIVPDRGRLSSSGQTSSDSGSEWNHFLFRDCVVAAWTDLLLSRRHFAWKKDLYKLWPRLNLSQSGELWSSLDDHIIDRIITRRLPVWNTSIGCVPFEQGFFVPDGDLVRDYGNSFRAIHLPLVCLEERMFEKLQQRALGLAIEVRILSPEYLRRFLQKNEQSRKIHDYTPLLLHYCLQDFIDGAVTVEEQSRLRNEFRGICLWPTLDNSSAMLKDEPFLLPRGMEEMALFSSSRKSKTLDLEHLAPPVLAYLQSYAFKEPNVVRQRTIADLDIDWTQIYKIDRPDDQADNRLRKKEDDELLRLIWGWISARCEEADSPPLLSIHNLDSLFLMPLNGCRIRKVVSSRKISLTLVLEDADWMRELWDERVSRPTRSASLVLDTKVLPTRAVKLLVSAATKRADLALTISSDLGSLLAWLADNEIFIVGLSDHQKKILTRQLSLLVYQQGPLLQPEVKQALSGKCCNFPSLVKSLLLLRTSKLPPLWFIQALIIWDRVSSTERVSIGTTSRSIRTIEALPPIPSVPGLAFYAPLDTDEKHLLKFFDLLEKVPLDDLFFEHLIPFIGDPEDSIMAEVKLQLVHFVLDKTSRPSDSFKSNFARFKLMPSSSRSGTNGVQFRPLATMVDPTSTIANLYFEDDDVFPEPAFLQRHHEVLRLCGLTRQLTQPILIERARTFATCSRGKQQLMGKLRALKWLPVTWASGKGFQMASPGIGRALDEKELVDQVQGVFEATVTPEWKAILGWDQVIERPVLLEQLKKSLAHRSRGRVDRVLVYLDDLGDCNFLKQTACILSSHGDYLLPERLLLPGGLLSKYPLAPYLDEVEPSFARKHSKLLKALGIRQDITFDDILNVQNIIIESAQTRGLSNDQLNVVISLLELSTQLQGDSKATATIKIPDTEGRLLPRSEIVCGDPNVTGKMASFSFVSSKVSPDLVARLGLENSFARATRLGIEFEDEDEDEYTPREKLTTTISDTLGRYTVDSTFSEFLANANDCGASQISWILDPCTEGAYESSALLSEELKQLQGSALFVYNNGVFSERDFQGFKEIGQGGKIDDETSTGMFGRGAMTMYHFTDVPMLISGDSFLILDPQQQLLPRNKHWKRKAGVKVSLATARRLFPDQLRPFHGLHGYSMEAESYDGTLYRLPFRSTERTLLKETSALVGVDETKTLLEDYHSTAQMSLLFLRSVNSIDYRVRDQKASWSVITTRPGGSADDIFNDINVTSSRGSKVIYEAVWRIGMTDTEEAPNDLANPGRRANKVTECGLAACLRSEGSFEKGLPHQLFCTLPTGFATQLPISVHASFAITGDRKTIAIEDTAKNTAITEWNQWLLTKCIPEFYLEFLKDLAPRLGGSAFQFWPSFTIEKSNQSFDKVIRDGFWNQLAGDQYESYQLFPLVENKRTTERSAPLKIRAHGKARKLFKVTSLKSAQFDVNPKKVSAILTPLFTNICPNLVYLPRRLWQDMITFNIHQKSVVLESQYVCDLFSIESNCVALEDFLKRLEDTTARDEVMETLLQIAIPKPSSDQHCPLERMNGCRIIPKLDQTLGNYKFRSGDANTWSRSEVLFLPTLAEAYLFANSASSLIKPSLFQEKATKHISSILLSGTTSHAPKNPLLDMVREFSNLRHIGISDIESFLPHLGLSTTYTGANDVMDRWIVELWFYLDPRLQIYRKGGDMKVRLASVAEMLQELKLHDTPIYRYDQNSSWRYITPQQFEEGPYIIAPSDQKELDLCRLFPGVEIIDPECLPSELHAKESSLDDPQAFGRLLKAITITGASNIRNTSVKSPDYACIKSLCGLIRRHAKPEIVEKHREILRSLPVWLQFSPTEPSRDLRCTSAQGALLCPHGAMLLPYIRQLDLFVDPCLVVEYSSTFRSLGCTIMDTEAIWKYLEPDLPQHLMPDQLRSYSRCIECLSRTNCKPSSLLAPNGYGRLCSPSTLFDHEDAIFIAAFRESPKKQFLHPDFQSRRSYWMRLGLRGRASFGMLKDSDFLLCVANIEARLKRPSDANQDEKDAAELTSYLRFHHAGLDAWSGMTWSTIVHARIYQTNLDVSSEPVYRQKQMLSLANNSGPCSIQYATSRAHLRVVWSQRPLLKDPPPASVYKHVGQPLLTSVYDHLHFLISIRDTITSQELSEYLKDLQATYMFLQECPTTASIPNFQQDKIWLNLPTTDISAISISQLDGTLRSAKSLCFNAPLDTHVVERAKNFLIPYESLLRKLGCRTISYPAKPNLAPRNKNLRRPIDQSLVVIRDMRKQQSLVDIVFEAEGQQIFAHRIFMAAVSEYCQRQFLGERGALLDAKPTVRIEDLTFKTLQHIVDFAYNGEVSWPVLANREDINEVADKLDELLDLLRGADAWLMESLHELAERHLLDHTEVYVRPDNVESVRNLADQAQAKHLLKHCKDYIRDNAEYVQDCKEMD